MAYIGNNIQNQGFAPAVDYFNGDGTTVTFTLSRPVASVAQLTAVIDNVIQNPSSAFTVSGNAITFTSAPLSGTNNIWVEYTSLVTTYAAISQDPSVIGDITATGGYLAEGDFGNSYIDGTIVDYVTGNARITTGPADGLTIYNGGTTARTALAAWDTSGNFTNTGNGTFSGTGFLQIPSGTTAQRPGTPTNGMLRYNSTTGLAEIYENSAWNSISYGYAAEYLVVGGGGGGATGAGGGGGGALTGSVPVTSGTAYPVTVGAGGAGASSGSGIAGSTGSNSSFSSATCYGGGGGGAYNGTNATNVDGLSGGCGGGGGWSVSRATVGGSGTAGQGYAGGSNSSTSPNPYCTAGGGGAGGVGSNSSGTSVSGNGGIGLLSDINGTSLYWAGGGGGGAQGGGSVAGNGGLGGGGGGSSYYSGGAVPTGGTGGGSALNTGGNGAITTSTGAANGGAGGTNTGGGGGGMGISVNAGGAGGSGIVIIRYLGSQRGTGGTVTTSGGYTIHTFTSSGTYTA